MLRDSPSIARGWSPAGVNSETSSNLGIVPHDAAAV
jgi:hypothetical protein